MGTPRFEPLSRRSQKAEQNRQIVLAYLEQKGPVSGEKLRDDLAARCGSKDIVGRALTELHRAGSIKRTPPGHRSGHWQCVKAAP